MNIVGRHKKFDKDLYKTYDGPAVVAVLAHLEGQGTWAQQGSDKYGVDIVVFSGLRPVAYIEVEVAATWTHGPWPYSDVHVLGRKGKWMLGQLGLPVSLWRLRKDLGRAVIVQDTVLSGDTLQVVPNRYMPEGEEMYCISLELIEEVTLELDEATK